MSVAVTAHAKKRLKERCGINKKSAVRMAERAFTEGISFYNAGELLQKYISSVYLRHNKMCNNLRIYGNTVYVFDNRTLITVYQIPQNILKEMNTIATSIDEVADKAYLKYEELPISRELTAKKMGFNTQMVQLNDIKIPKHISQTRPNIETLKTHRSYYISTGQIKEPITLGSDNYLVNGYCDYLIAKEYQYDFISCVIQDTPGNIRNRSNARKELYEQQDGKCSFCDRQIPFELTSMIQEDGRKYCICPECVRLYSIKKNPQHSKQTIRPKKSQITFYPANTFLTKKNQVNISIMGNFLQQNLNKQHIEITHIGIKNDEVGIYVELIVDDYKKISSKQMNQLATFLGIRIKCR